MLDRNLLKAGDSVFPLPIGLPVTLTYNIDGRLTSVTSEVAEGQDVKLLSLFLKNSYAPARILTNNGTAQVKGVVYSMNMYSECLGRIPRSQAAQIISDMESGENLVFGAGYANVSSINMNTLSQVRTWLQSNKINLLPSFIIPLGELEKSCDRALKATDLSYQQLMGFFIYRGKDFIEYYIGNSWDKITYIGAFLDESGHIRCNVSTELGLNTVLSFYEVAKLCLYTDDIVLVDKNNHFEFNLSAYQRKEVPDFTYTCPICGKKYVVDSEYTLCPDPHCTSRLYPDVVNFAQKLNLPDLTYTEYIEYVQNGAFVKLSDVLMFSEYQDYEIKVAVPDLLEAIIPFRCVRNRQSIWELYNKCNGSWDSVNHYIINPQEIQQDLKIYDQDLINWLTDAENQNTILDIVSYSNIVFTQEAKRFEGSPIFRKTSIAITGTFRHGNYSDISSILLSYDAKVSDGKDAEICIVGDIKENVDSRIVKSVKDRGGFIYTETEFFNKYGIDDDLQQLVR